MASRLRYLFWIVALAMMPATLLAQGNVLVTLFRPPPNQLRVADLWKVDLQNLGPEVVTVYLHGTVDEATDGRVVDARSKPFRIPGGARMRVTGAELEPITVDKWNDAYKDVLLRTGQVPTGSYTVCVEVVLAEDGSIIGTDCYEQPVDIEQLTPPMLVFPLDESEVTEQLPTFNWLPPTPVRQGDRISYQIRIVEMLGRQSAYDAIASNPAFFDLRDITANSVRFPLGARRFEIGRRYAWQIRAFLVQRFGDRIPVGESEIWWFQYGTVDKGDELTDDDGDGRRDPARDLPVRETDITRDDLDIRTPASGDSPDIRFGQKYQVEKDLGVRPGFIPPDIFHDKRIVEVKPEFKLNPVLLRALMHTCQGMD